MRGRKLALTLVISSHGRARKEKRTRRRRWGRRSRKDNDELDDEDDDGYGGGWERSSGTFKRRVCKLEHKITVVTGAVDCSLLPTHGACVHLPLYTRVFDPAEANYRGTIRIKGRSDISSVGVCGRPIEIESISTRVR